MNKEEAKQSIKDLWNCANELGKVVDGHEETSAYFDEDIGALQNALEKAVDGFDTLFGDDIYPV